MAWWTRARSIRAVMAMVWLCALGALTLSGCGGGGGVTAADGFALRIHWPDNTRLIPAATQSIRVLVRDAGGFQTFRVANRPSAGGFSTLIFFGLAPGALDVDAQAYPITDAQGVAVAEASTRVTLASGAQTSLTLDLTSTIDRIELAPQRLDIRPGSASTLTATAKNTTGDVVPMTASKAQWVSSDTSIATVDTAGKVIARKEGSATITYTDSESGKSGTVLVVASNSNPGIIDHIDVTPTPNALFVGQEKTLTATLRDALGNALAARPGTWTTSASSIAIVDANGKVQGIGAGVATITFTETASGKSGSASVSVTVPTVESVTLTPSSTTLTVGQKFTFTVTLKDGQGNTLPAEPGTWSSSAPATASVDSATGEVTALQTTASPVLITFTHTASGKSGSASVTIDPAP